MPRGRRAAQAAQPQPSPVTTVSETATQPPPPSTQHTAATRSSHSRNPPDNDGESFDLENVSDVSDSDEDQADAPQARRGRSQPAANTSNLNIQVNDPTPTAKKGMTALDIEYFYNRQKGRDTFCKECKYVVHLNHFFHILTCYIMNRALHDENPTAWPNGRTYTFSDSTSTSSLRPHLEKYHSELYLSLAQERGWKIQLPGVVSRARSNAGEASQDSRPDEFSEETFHNYLMRFIVADDQVSFLLIMQGFLTDIFSSP